MSGALSFLLSLHTPLWLSFGLGLGLLYLLWRQRAMARLLRYHAASIANMDRWADVADERLDRVDWVKQRPAAANDQPRRRLRMTA